MAIARSRRAGGGGLLLAFGGVAACWLCWAPRTAFVPAPGGASEQQPMEGGARRRLLAAGVASVLLGGDFAQVNALPRLTKLPPINRLDTKRCRWIQNNMGQSNGARSDLYDLRECQLAGTSVGGKDIAGVALTGGNFTGTDFSGATLSKAIAGEKTIMTNAKFINAVADRVYFEDTDLRGAQFQNALLTGTSFTNANLEGADFSEATIDTFGVQYLCENPTLKGKNPVTGADSYESALCDIKNVGATKANRK